MKDYKDYTGSLSKYMKELRGLQPETMTGFSAMATGAKKNGALDKKAKEFVALGIAVATRCDGCIGFHVKELLDLGATREELGEVLAMAVYMGGGPSVMYAAHALKAYEDYTK
jgi:AhpD family alkylhydroperoxidase